MVQMSLVLNQKRIKNVLSCVLFTAYCLNASINTENLKTLKEIPLDEKAYHCVDNFAITYNNSVKILNNIQETKICDILPNNFLRLVRHIGMIDTEKIPHHLDGDDALSVTLNKMNFEDIGAVARYLETKRIDCHKVVVLDVSYNEISTITREHMSYFPNLQSFNCMYNKVATIAPDVFGNCIHLRMLNLQKNAISSGLSLVLDSFHKHEDLRFSVVNHNPINSKEKMSLWNFYAEKKRKIERNLAHNSNDEIFYTFTSSDPDDCFGYEMLLTATGLEKDNLCQQFIAFVTGRDEALEKTFLFVKYKKYINYLSPKFVSLLNIMLKVIKEMELRNAILDDALEEYNNVLLDIILTEVKEQTKKSDWD